ncbi:hypothetical protein BH23VER1_BH23VER1_17180 [soil metagenome]
MKLLLEDDGHQAVLAYNGEEAIAQALEHDVQVVLLDIALPDRDGYEVAKVLRERHADITLIALTGWGRIKDVQKATSAGFDHHLLKPVEYGDIKKILVRRSQLPGTPAT